MNSVSAQPVVANWPVPNEELAEKQRRTGLHNAAVSTLQPTTSQGWTRGSLAGIFGLTVVAFILISATYLGLMYLLP